MIKVFDGLTHNIPMEVRDYVEWHKNREHYSVWVIDFDERAILDEVERARYFFEDWLLKPFERQPHITLFVSGFIADSATHDDDYSLSQQTAHQQILTQSNLKNFDIEVCGLNSFASALYFDVMDKSDGINQIREVLAQTMPELRWKAFVPHITIGLYKDHIPTQDVIQKIKEYQPAPVVKKSVRDIKLMTYSAQELIGPLTTRFTHLLTD
jgi:2'-5' RNA ligase